MRKVCPGLALISISNALRTTRSASEIDVAGPGRLREIGLVKLWKWEPENLPHVVHSICTAVAEAAPFWRLRLPGPELRPGSRNKAQSKLHCGGGRVARDPRILQATRLPLQKIRQPTRTAHACLVPRVTNSGNSFGCKIPARISRLSTMRGPGRAK